MKNKLFYITSLLFLLLCEQAAAQEVSITKDAKNYNTLIFKDINGQVDTLRKFAYRISIVASEFFPETVCVIVQEPMSFRYLKLKKEEGKWKRQRTSGDLIFYEKYKSSIPPKNQRYFPHSFEILEEDIVSYEIDYYTDTPDKTVIKDCKDFEVEFLRREKEYLKKKKNEK